MAAGTASDAPERRLRAEGARVHAAVAGRGTARRGVRTEAPGLQLVGYPDRNRDVNEDAMSQRAQMTAAWIGLTVLLTVGMLGGTVRHLRATTPGARDLSGPARAVLVKRPARRPAPSRVAGEPRAAALLLLLAPERSWLAAPSR